MYRRQLPSEFRQLLFAGQPAQAQSDMVRAGHTIDEIEYGFRCSFFDALKGHWWGQAWGILLFAQHTERIARELMNVTGYKNAWVFHMSDPEGLAMIAAEELLPAARLLLHKQLDDIYDLYHILNQTRIESGNQWLVICTLWRIIDAHTKHLHALCDEMSKLLPALVRASSYRPIGDYWRYMHDTGYQFGDEPVEAWSTAATPPA